MVFSCLSRFANFGARLLIGVGLFADRSKIKGWAEGLLGAELGGIIIMILALPIFLVMSVFGKRESDR